MQIQKLKLGQQNNNEGSINLAGANKKATLKCKKIIIKTLAKLHTNLSTVTLESSIVLSKVKFIIRVKCCHMLQSS